MTFNLKTFQFCTLRRAKESGIGSVDLGYTAEEKEESIPFSPLQNETFSYRAKGRTVIQYLL